MPLNQGARLGPHEILAPLGAGGMGEVYRARHLKLDRDVAIKVLPASVVADPERRARFEREARTASALNHPNIVTIHDIAEHDGTTYISMELVEGHTLRELIEAGPMPVDQILRLASQITDGLSRAHAAGIVHRDIKPANVMVTEDGLLKILDFGLAKPLRTSEADAVVGATLTRDTAAILGTPHYMSPEQLSGDPADHRSDQFAFGVLLYEMIGGSPPFEGASLAAVVTQILTRDPPPLRRLRADAPADLERIVARCLEKDPDERFSSMADVGAALTRAGERRLRAAHGLLATVGRPAIARSLGVALLGLVVAGWLWALGSGRRWAEHEALGEITSLIETGELYEAYRTALEAETHRPADPELERVFEGITLPATVNTVPAGALVQVRAYGRHDAPWHTLGVTPVRLRAPYAAMHWRITKEGYEPFEGAPFSPGSLRVLAQGLVLDRVGTRPAGTVRIPGGRLEGPVLLPPVRFLAGVELEPYYLERYEVTNREFKEFVDAGGYHEPAWWASIMVRGGREIPWEEATDTFRDATGRYGPSTWELGDYPDGEDDHPVGGIGWFEAAAYCAFRGRSLPTVYHWLHAIGQEQVSDILPNSNMDGGAKAAVGEFRGLSAYGAYDMAGNVREWAWNATEDMRYALGGSWNEPGYLFKHLVGQDPWAREPTDGVRCAQYPEPPAQQLMEPVTPLRAYPRPERISDEAFAALRGQYAYDEDPLEARVERVNDSLPGYRRETVAFRTGYGSERMQAHLLIPHDVEPPYQSVIWFPGDDVFSRRSSDDFASAWLFDWLPSAGRVLVHPVYRGMYERFEPWERTPNDWRNMMISWARDIGRTIDYLETRPEFDATKVAYYGFSSGAVYAPVFAAVEPRIAVSMFIGGGLIPREMPPAMHPVHFAPRSRTPSLMINGRDDFLLPYEVSQRPLFDLLGAPEDHKRHARLRGGHIPSDPREIKREVLDWLDEHLGPIEPTGPGVGGRR